ncbi:MAG: protein translocase subunit SecF [Pseudomonadota bacterium]
MEILKLNRDIPFMRYARSTIVVSSALFVIAVGALLVRGLNLGVDFTGGTIMEVSYAQAADLPTIRSTLGEAGFSDALVQNFGTSRDVLIRLPVREGVTSAQLSNQVFDLLKQKEAGAELRRVEFVGPQVGAELLYDGSLALLVVTAGIMLYLMFRFEWRFSVGAIVATAHDIVFILGLFALFQWEFSLTVLAAVLAILGYSVNDTVVVFDRIRENFKKMRKATTAEIIDHSVTQTLARTIILSFTTQLMVLAILFFGGEVLFGFALALTIGIVVGTYSSVLVASPIVMWLGVSRADFIKPEKKEAEQLP